MLLLLLNLGASGSGGGLNEFEVDVIDRPKREVCLEPTLQKAIRLRNEAQAEFSTPKQKRKAKQIAIRAAKKLAESPLETPETSLLAFYFEWLSLYASEPQENARIDQIGQQYAAFLSTVGTMLYQWQQDEEEAILALML